MCVCGTSVFAVSFEAPPQHCNLLSQVRAIEDLILNLILSRYTYQVENSRFAESYFRFLLSRHCISLRVNAIYFLYALLLPFNDTWISITYILVWLMWILTDSSITKVKVNINAQMSVILSWKCGSCGEYDFKKPPIFIILSSFISSNNMLDFIPWDM